MQNKTLAEQQATEQSVAAPVILTAHELWLIEEHERLKEVEDATKTLDS